MPNGRGPAAGRRGMGPGKTGPLRAVGGGELRKLNRTVTAVAAAALTVFVSAAAQVSGPGRVSLKFSPAPGSGLTYGIQARVTGDGKDLMGKSLRTEVRAQGDVIFKVLDSPPGLVRTGITIPAISVNAQMAGSDVHGTIRTAQNKRLSVVFNSTGRVSEIRNTEVVEQDFSSNIGFTQILNDYFPVLPDKPVSVGDTWSDTRTLHVPFGGMNLNITLVTEYRLDDILPSKDGPTAFITTTYKAQVHGRTPLEGGAGIFEGTGGGTGFLHYLTEKGTFSGYQTAFSVQASFSVKQGETVLLNWPFSFDSFSLITLTSLGD